MRKILAKINATTPYQVDEFGNVYGKYGKIKGKAVKNCYTRVLDYCQKENPIEITSVTIPRLIYQSFNPEIILTKDDVVVLINPKEEHIFALSNLKVIKRQEQTKYNEMKRSYGSSKK
jgi:hypothetical protein